MNAVCGVSPTDWLLVGQHQTSLTSSFALPPLILADCGERERSSSRHLRDVTSQHPRGLSWCRDSL